MAAGSGVRRLVPALILTVALSVLTAFAVMATGHRVQKLDLNNSGIWATNDRLAKVGRFNKSASVLDMAVNPGQVIAPHRVDVLQDGNTVVIWDLGKSRLLPVDTLAGAAVVERAVGVQQQTRADFRGGTLATLDAATGKLWAVRIPAGSGVPELSALDAAAKPVAELDPAPSGMTADSAAGLSVAADGTIHAASGSGKTVVVPVTAQGFGEPRYDRLQVPSLKDVQVAGLGGRSAVLDVIDGRLYLPGGKSVSLSGVDRDARIQQGGSDLDTVLVATVTSLISVSLADASPVTLFEGGHGAPSAPVNLGRSVTTGTCQIGAWAGTPGVVARACDGGPAIAQQVDRNNRLIRPAIRVNWNTLIVNDMEDGRIFDVDINESLDDWTALEPDQKKDDDQDQPTKSTRPKDAKPKAKPDSYGARPGRTSILNVLDNDSDPAGNVLSITEVTKPSGNASATISPDGQSIRFHMPEDGANATFSYTISNQDHQDKAEVRVGLRRPEDNAAPRLREHAKLLSFPVGAEESVTMPVLADWRDPDGDPITVSSATDAGEDVPVTSDGQIEYTAAPGRKDATSLVRFSVSDGIADPVDGRVRVRIQGSDATVGVAPVAQADAVRGEVGKPIAILPLANDIPGVDPGSAQTRLTLAAEVVGGSELKPVTDRQAGRVTVTPQRADTYFLEYTAKFGGAPTATGKIRIDATDDGDTAPVTMPDQAVVRGQSPVTIDVLANDSDPGGGLLTVQTAGPADDQAEILEVAIIKGRWLRIVPLVPDLPPDPQVVTYTVTNGDGRYVEGDVRVTQLPGIEPDRPLVRPDFAAVRAGDTTLVPVLQNDTSLGGSPLSLRTYTSDLPAGQMRVVDEDAPEVTDPARVGKAYVVGDRLRYVAPVGVDEQRQVAITYLATTAGSNPVRGTVHVTVNPEPGERKNAPPVPQSIELRAVSGDTVTIPIPSSGQDPDGDSVSLVGLGSPPKLGRILAITPKGLSYQAYPSDSSIGTDTFSYTVVDRYGERGTGQIRVAVVPPGQTQLPVALDDIIEARPGAVLRIDALANDLIAQSDKASIRPLADGDVTVPDGVELAAPEGPIKAVAPGLDAEKALSFDYGVSGNGGDGTKATITITAKDGYLHPPRVYDEVATVTDEKTASADVLAKAWDPDGETSGLRITGTSDPAATVAGGTISVPLLHRPQVIAFEVADADQATSAALLYVPASGDGVPYAQGVINLGVDQSATVDLAQHIVSPRGRPIRFTVDKTLATSPRKSLQVEAGKGFTSVELTASDGYVGPASLSLEVTDGESLTDPDARTAFVSIPVQIGPEQPVLRCPEEPQTITAGSRGRALDLATLCHVWTADPAQVDTLTFTADWSRPLGNVTHTADGRSVTLSATGSAIPDDKGSLTIGVAGTDVRAELPVLVKAAPRPRLAPIVVRNVKQGTRVTGKVSLTSPLNDPQPTIISLEPYPGVRARVDQPVGNEYSITPDADASGEMKFRLVASDLADPGRTDRFTKETTLTLFVYGLPGAPGVPKAGRTAQSKSATLTWKQAENNGATIQHYRVTSDSGRTWTCETTPCTVKPLDNAVPIRFTVAAYNKAGFGPESPVSAVVIPDQPPSKVTGFTASDPRDGQISLSWKEPVGEFTPVTHYTVTAGGRSETVRGTSVTLKGLSNQETTFSIWAHNDTGRSKTAATTTGWPTGQPGEFDIGSIQAENINADASAVSITWSAAEPNGEGPVRYSLERDGSAVGGCQSVTAQSCTDDSVALDGRSHTYRVTATNAPEVYTRDASRSWNAEGTPSRPSAPKAVATGEDRRAGVTGSTGDSRGPAGESFVEIYSDNSLQKSVAVNSRGDSYSVDIEAGANNDSHTISVKLCYNSADGGRKCSDGQGTDSVVPFGPLSQPSLSANAGATTVAASASGNGNGREATLTLTSSDGRRESVTGTGSLSVDVPSYEVGYSRTTTFTATLTTAKTTPSRGDAPARSAEVRTQDPPPPSRTVTISKSSATKSGCSYYGGGNCPYVELTTRGFSGSYTCDFYREDQSGPWFTPMRLTGDFSGTSSAWFGFNDSIYVRCDGVESNHVPW